MLVILRILVSLLLLATAAPVLFFTLVLGVPGLGYFNPLLSMIGLGTASVVAVNLVAAAFSFRFVPLILAALAAFYAGWAFSDYPFPDQIPFRFGWPERAVLVLTFINLVWIKSYSQQCGFNARDQAKIAGQTLAGLAVLVLAYQAFESGQDGNALKSVFLWIAAFTGAALDLGWIIWPNRQRPARRFPSS